MFGIFFMIRFHDIFVPNKFYKLEPEIRTLFFSFNLNWHKSFTLNFSKFSFFSKITKILQINKTDHF